MGGSRSYSVTSNGSTSSGGSSSNFSANYSDYNTVGSEKLSKLTSTNSRTTRHRVLGGEAVATMMPLPHQRARPLQIMCRCCLSEKQQQSSACSSLKPCSDEESQLLEFVSLDTLAMVDLRDDKYTTSTSVGTGNDSSIISSCRTPSAARGDKVNSMPTTPITNSYHSGNGNGSGSGSNISTTTLLDCLNACARIGASLADIELPQHICLDCYHTLEMCCEFIRCVRNADKILRRRCALPAKRTRQQQQQLLLPQQTNAANMPAARSEAYGWEGPAAKRRRRREEKMQQEQRLIVGRTIFSARPSVKNLGNNTPKSKSLPKAVTATPTVAAMTAESDELLDISVSLDSVDCVGSSFVRSIDSGIEIDEDLSSVKSSDCSANENAIRCHLAKYEGYTYVVAETLSLDLERFHRSGHSQVSIGGGGGATAGASATYKCGFCIFECSVRQELNKHLKIHLGPPQHSCRKCNFVGHFKFLLAQHMRNVHHCALDTLGTAQEVCQTNAGKRVNDIARGCQAAGIAVERPKYHCNLCGECFVNYDGLQQHRKSHKVFCKCTICTYKSSTRENVLEHLAKEHKVLVERQLIVKYIPLQRINVEQMQEFATTKNISEFTESNLLLKDNKYRKHLCQFCGKCFDRRFHLLKHEYGVHRLEIELQNGADATIRGKSFGYGVAGSTSTKHTKLKYLRQRNAVQAARQRCIEDLALLDDQHSGQDITNKFQCEICSAVFMFNFELKYHMRTHKISTHIQMTTGKGLGDTRTGTPSPPLSAVATTKCAQEQSAVIATECAQQTGKSKVKCGGDSDGEGEAEDDSLNCVKGFSNNMDATLSGFEGGVDLDLMALVGSEMSPLESLDASPTSSNTSFDINYDDQLYLNDFDLGLLDCGRGFGVF